MEMRTAEVVVIGAGFAGLAAAQVLGRAQRQVLVLGAGPTRNAEAEHAHNLLTRDGTPPAELLRLGREEVETLPTVRLEEAHVVAVMAGADERLHVGTAGGDEIRAEAVLLTTGARDTLPEVRGLPALWGRRAHSCPFCDAEAYAGQRLLVLADEERGAHAQAMLGGWTDRVTRADPGGVAHIGLVDGDVVAQLTDGSSIVADGVFVGVTPVPRLDCVADLPLARRGPYLATDGGGRTTHPRLWAAGDCTWRASDAAPGGMVVAAMASAAQAAASIVLDRVGVQRPAPPPLVEPASSRR